MNESKFVNSTCWCGFFSASLHFEGSIFTVHRYILSSFLQNPGSKPLISSHFFPCEQYIHGSKQSLRACLLQGIYCSQGWKCSDISCLDLLMCAEEEERITVNNTFLTSPHIANFFEESHISKCIFLILTSFFLSLHKSRRLLNI